MGIKQRILSILHKGPFRYVIRVYTYLFEGGEFFSESIRYIYQHKYNTKADIGSYGCFNDQFNIFKGDVRIGRWCSIASGVRYVPGNHPKGDISTHPIFHRKEYGFCLERKFAKNFLHIGNDVWIGINTLIMPGCQNIGNGAIIGGGTVLTHDVEPYSIVAGNPGKVIGKRFDENTITMIEESEWWNLDIKKLKEIIPYQEDIELFCKLSREAQNF